MRVRRSEPTPREQEIIAMRRAGQTLDAIGQHYGVSRECVRQLLQKHGITGDVQSLEDPAIDPIRALRVARHPGCTSLVEVCAALGLKAGDRRVTILFIALGVMEPLKRLFSWRQAVQQRQRLLQRMRGFIEAHGRLPYATEMGTKGPEERDASAPLASNIVSSFGSMERFWAELGEAPRSKGTNGHRIPTNPYRSRRRRK